MRNIEIILKLLVPILFLVVWALNQVLSKDAKQAAGQFGKKPPLPPQPGRRPDWAGPGPMERRLGPNAGRDEIMTLPGEPRDRKPPAPASGPTTARSTPPAPNPFDTMVDRVAGPSTANRGRKNRRAVATAPRPTPPATPRLGPENRPGASPTPTGGMSQATAAGGAALAVGAALARPARSNDALVALKAALGSPKDVRQALILAEVLQRPVSMRRRGGR